jgi:hypothetical protein
MSSTTAVCGKGCIGTVSRSFAPPAFLLVNRLYGKIEQVRAVTELCVTCRRVLAPVELAQQQYRVIEMDHANAELVRRRNARDNEFQHVIGKAGDFTHLGLPSWYDVLAPVPRLPDKIRDEVLQNQSVEARRGAIRHKLGIGDLEDQAVINTFVGDVTVNGNTVGHLLQKKDSGHNQLLHIFAGTLASPLEAWEGWDHEHKRDALIFLRQYRIGFEGAPVTQLVAVDLAQLFVYTTYEIDDGSPSRNSIEERVNARRSGTCRHLAY